jgi:hypothetical protein
MDAVHSEVVLPSLDFVARAHLTLGDEQNYDLMAK